MHCLRHIPSSVLRCARRHPHRSIAISVSKSFTNLTASGFPFSLPKQPFTLAQTRFKSTKSSMVDATQSPLSGLYHSTQTEKIFYGPDSVKKHLLSCLPTKSSKAFIITGSSLANKSPVVSNVEKLLGEHHAGTFSNIKQHAPVADLDQATDKVLSDSSIDTLISIGGGSPIDSAKAISYRYHERASSSSSSSSPPSFLHHISIPTTLSAAECTMMAGFTSAEGQKTGVRDPHLVPNAILYDATFIAYTPAQLYLSTGLRALDHAVETLYHPTASELTRRIALTAIADLFTYLPRYKADTSDNDAITQLQIASYASLGFMGLNLKGGLGLSHALGYALGSPYGIPHGVTSCLTLGKVVRLKVQTGGDEVVGQIVRAAGAVGIKDAGVDDKAKVAEEVGERIEDLVRRLGLERKLGEFKVGKDQVPVIVKAATGGKEDGPVYDAVKGLVETLW